MVTTDFLQNCLEYLTNKKGIIETRNKDIVLRLLDSKKIEKEKNDFKIINQKRIIGLVIHEVLFNFSKIFSIPYENI